MTTPESPQENDTSFKNATDSLQHIGVSLKHTDIVKTHWRNFSGETHPLTHGALSESLSTGRVWRVSSPRVERIAQEYANSALSESPENLKDFTKRMSDELQVPERSVAASMSTKAFPAILSKYMPLDSVAERHEQLMKQDKDLKVAADMVKLGYKVHRVDGSADAPQKGGFAQFLQQINNYGGEPKRDTHDGTTEGSHVEIVESVQDQDQERHD